MKKFISLLTVFTVLIFNTVGVFAQNDNTVGTLNQYSNSQLNVESLTINNEQYTYKSQENINTRQIDVYNGNAKKISTVIYDKNSEKLFVDGKEIPVDIEISTETSFSELDIKNEDLSGVLTSIGPWHKFGQVEKFKYSIKAHLATAVAVAGIAALVGGPIGAFLGMYSVWDASKTNCSVKKTTYIRTYNSKSQFKYVSKVYWGRNFDEYFYTAEWRSSPK